MTYNRSALLADCLRSLVRQTYASEKTDILVVDDGSADSTRDVVEDFAHEHPNVRYFRQANRGIAAARNAGIKRAEGELICLLADDYRLPENYLDTVDRLYSRHAEVRAIRFRLVTESRSFLGRAMHLHDEVEVYNSLASNSMRWTPSPLERLRKRFRRLVVNAGGEPTANRSLRPVHSP